ncbi:krueppel-like factor 15 [Colletotrichum liriopes]|uniref:Krueppel-like factor 15 n=1 Tax=Colletotrichum liriopes TaxID=708192 RepID=A0AA37LPL5_9PEZI|nr:krueppel-like factor 15 [Colletotrichum liriopes]
MDYHPFGMTPTDGNWDDMAATPVPVSHIGAVGNSGVVGNRLICPGCQAHCKTKSELKCDVSGCTRKEGFGTLNDLDRHKGSVHPDVFNAGPRFRCQIGACQTKDKIWPRADNFRQHLKRVHRQHVNPEDDLSEFSLQPSPQRPQDDSFQQNAQDALEGVGSELFSSYNSGHLAWDGRPPVFEDIQLSPQEEQPTSMDLILDPSLTSADGPASDVSLDSSDVDMAGSKVQPQNQISGPICEPTGHEFVQPKEITRAPSPKAGFGGPKDDSSNGLRANEPQRIPINMSLGRERHAPGPDRAMSEALDSSLTDSMDCDVSAKAPSHQVLGGSSREERPVDQEEQPMKQLPSILQNKGLSQQALLDLLSQVPKDVIEIFLKSQTEAAPQKTASTPSINANSQHWCTHSSCQKGFNRKCELKKHMKRHEKPYGCTFPNCKKKFGSKNDWKRHENSQHFQVEMWKCHEKQADNENESCGKVCHRRETFRSHLAREHKMDDTEQIDKVLEKCRVGRNGEPRFWCGFCIKIVEITEKGANAWAERFNHIDSHYAGRHNLSKKDHSDWVAVDPELPEADLAGSPDDSSDSDSADEGPVAFASRKLEGNPKAVSGQTRKRSLSDDGEQRHTKRVKTYRWICCACAWDADYKVHASCINCSHNRCSNCVVKNVMVRNEMGADRSTKNQE